MFVFNLKAKQKCFICLCMHLPLASVFFHPCVCFLCSCIGIFMSIVLSVYFICLYITFLMYLCMRSILCSLFSVSVYVHLPFFVHGFGIKFQFTRSCKKHLIRVLLESTRERRNLTEKVSLFIEQKCFKYMN